MNTKNCLNLLQTLLIFVLLTGCSSISNNKPITNDIAGSYVDLDAFVKARLGTSKSFSGYKSSINEDGSITYTAHFNNTNYKSLRKPKEDIQGFCSAKRGEYKVISSASTERQLNSYEAGVTNRAEAYLYVLMNAGSHKPLLSKLSDEGYFGVSTCEMDESKWEVSIIPQPGIRRSQTFSDVGTIDLLITTSKIE